MRSTWLRLTVTQVFLWRVPENFTVRPDVESDDVQDVSPVGKLSGHPRSEYQTVL